jgi:cyclophilin family peptidyl-prolyl cis-trans isomerase
MSVNTCQHLATVVMALVISLGCQGDEGAARPRSPVEDVAYTEASLSVDTDTTSVVRIAIETSKGKFVIEVHREWAPHGAERFLDLVESGYYNDARFHRVVPGFIVQWGLAANPDRTAEWATSFIPDDPVLESNTRGRIGYAFTDPGTRSTQVFINLVDNVRLDSVGFAVFGEVVSSMNVVDSLYSGYGENSGGGLRRGDQSNIVRTGNVYLDREFPLLDQLERAQVIRP